MDVLRVVVDSSVIVAGLRSQLGASNRMLTLVAERRLVPLVTTALFFEYEDVLNRPEQRLTTGMAKDDVLGFLAALASAADDFLRERAGTAKPKDMLKYLRRAPKVAPNADDVS
jgi:predicted nucleic acid-binding protein